VIFAVLDVSLDVNLCINGSFFTFICTKFGLGGPPADVINCAEFCCSQLMGFDSVRGQNSPYPIDLAGRR